MELAALNFVSGSVKAPALRLAALLALASLGGIRPARAQACLVRGDEVVLEGVTVQPRGAKPFNLGLRGVPVTAKIPARAGAATELRVTNLRHHIDTSSLGGRWTLLFSPAHPTGWHLAPGPISSSASGTSTAAVE